MAPWKVVASARRRLLGTVVGVRTEEPAVALTFDDGPDATSTPMLLDVLRTARARATFFVVGEAAQAHPRILERMRAEGHCIANHAWNHTSFLELSPSGMRNQLWRCDRLIAPYGGKRLFRPPYGHQDFGSRVLAAALGFQVIAWNVHGSDWRLGGNAREIADEVLSQLAPGAIVLLHDAVHRPMHSAQRDRRATVEAVRTIVTTRTPRYRFVTVPELLRLGTPRRRYWKKIGESGRSPRAARSGSDRKPASQGPEGGRL